MYVVGNLRNSIQERMKNTYMRYCTELFCEFCRVSLSFNLPTLTNVQGDLIITEEAKTKLCFETLLNRELKIKPSATKFIN